MTWGIILADLMDGLEPSDIDLSSVVFDEEIDSDGESWEEEE